MRQAIVRIVLIVAVCLLAAETAHPQTSTVLPGTSQTTTLTVAVPEQARVTVPAGVTFDVTNIGTSTAAGQVTVAVNSIVLATATRQLKISLKANASAFTPPLTGAATWSAEDVSFTAPAGGQNAWVNATRTNGTLSSAAFQEAARCTADTASCSTTGFTFILAPKTTVKRSGTHTLTVTWKFESIGV